METDPVSETWCLLKMLDVGQVQKSGNTNCNIPSSEPFRTDSELFSAKVAGITAPSLQEPLICK
jgi:hypothetical protein